MTTDTKPLAAELDALASKAIHAAMWGNATTLEPDDVRMLQMAACALSELTAVASEMNRLAKGPAGGVSVTDKRAIVSRMDAALARIGAP